MHPSKTNENASKLKLVKLAAKANLLMALLSHSDQNLERQRTEIQRRDGDLTRLRSEIARCDSEIAQLISEIARRDDELVRLRNEIENRDGEVARLRSEIDRRDGELVRLRGEVEQNSGELRRAVQQLRSVEHGREQALNANALLLNSTSWRIMAPVRALGGFVKRYL